MKSVDLDLQAFAPDDPRFSGHVSALRVLADEDPSLHVFLVEFGPAGRTAWHSHEKGQLLVCTAGSGCVGTRDGAVIDLRPGVSVWTGAGEDHWHGAGPNEGLTHLAIQTETPGTDGVDWKESVETLPWRIDD